MSLFRKLIGESIRKNETGPHLLNGPRSYGLTDATSSGKPVSH